METRARAREHGGTAPGGASTEGEGDQAPREDRGSTAHQEQLVAGAMQQELDQGGRGGGLAAPASVQGPGEGGRQQEGPAETGAARDAAQAAQEGEPAGQEEAVEEGLEGGVEAPREQGRKGGVDQEEEEGGGAGAVGAQAAGAWARGEPAYGAKGQEARLALVEQCARGTLGDPRELVDGGGPEQLGRGQRRKIPNCMVGEIRAPGEGRPSRGGASGAGSGASREEEGWYFPRAVVTVSAGGCRIITLLGAGGMEGLSQALRERLPCFVRLAVLDTDLMESSSAPRSQPLVTYTIVVGAARGAAIPAAGHASKGGPWVEVHILPNAQDERFAGNLVVAVPAAAFDQPVKEPMLYQQPVRDFHVLEYPISAREAGIEGSPPVLSTLVGDPLARLVGLVDSRRGSTGAVRGNAAEEGKRAAEAMAAMLAEERAAEGDSGGTGRGARSGAATAAQVVKLLLGGMTGVSSTLGTMGGGIREGAGVLEQPLHPAGVGAPGDEAAPRRGREPAIPSQPGVPPGERGAAASKASPSGAGSSAARWVEGRTVEELKEILDQPPDLVGEELRRLAAARWAALGLAGGGSGAGDGGPLAGTRAGMMGGGGGDGGGGGGDGGPGAQPAVPAVHMREILEALRDILLSQGEQQAENIRRAVLAQRELDPRPSGREARGSEVRRREAEIRVRLGIKPEDGVDIAGTRRLLEAVIKQSGTSRASPLDMDDWHLEDALTLALGLKVTRGAVRGPGPEACGPFRYALTTAMVQAIVSLRLGGPSGLSLRYFRTLPEAERGCWVEGKSAHDTSPIITLTVWVECMTNMAHALGVFLGYKLSMSMQQVQTALLNRHSAQPSVYPVVILVQLVETYMDRWVATSLAAVRAGQPLPAFDLAVRPDCPTIQELVVERRRLLLEDQLSSLIRWGQAPRGGGGGPGGRPKASGQPDDADEQSDQRAGGSEGQGGGERARHEAERARLDQELAAGPSARHYAAATAALVTAGRVQVEAAAVGPARQVCYQAHTAGGCKHPGTCNMIHVPPEVLRKAATGPQRLPAVELLALLLEMPKVGGKSLPQHQRRARYAALREEVFPGPPRKSGGDGGPLRLDVTWPERVRGCYPGASLPQLQASTATPQVPARAPLNHVQLRQAPAPAEQQVPMDPARRGGTRLARSLLREEPALAEFEDTLCHGLGRYLEAAALGTALPLDVRPSCLRAALRQLEPDLARQSSELRAAVRQVLAQAPPLQLSRAAGLLVSLGPPPPAEGGTMAVTLGPFVMTAVETGQVLRLPSGLTSARACVYLSLAYGLAPRPAGTPWEAEALEELRVAAGALKVEAAAAAAAAVSVVGLPPSEASATAIRLYEYAHDLMSTDHACDVSWLAYFPLPRLATTSLIIVHVTERDGVLDLAVDRLRGLEHTPGDPVLWVLQHSGATGGSTATAHMRPLRAGSVSEAAFLAWVSAHAPLRDLDCVGATALLELDRAPPAPCASRRCAQCREALHTLSPPPDAAATPGSGAGGG